MSPPRRESQEAESISPARQFKRPQCQWQETGKVGRTLEGKNNLMRVTRSGVTWKECRDTRGKTREEMAINPPLSTCGCGVETKNTFAFFSECKWQDSGGEGEVMQMEGCNILWEDAENWGDAENRGEYRENMCSMSKLHKHLTWQSGVEGSFCRSGSLVGNEEFYAFFPLKPSQTLSVLCQSESDAQFGCQASKDLVSENPSPTWGSGDKIFFWVPTLWGVRLLWRIWQVHSSPWNPHKPFPSPTSAELAPCPNEMSAPRDGNAWLLLQHGRMVSADHNLFC